MPFGSHFLTFRHLVFRRFFYVFFDGHSCFFLFFLNGPIVVLSKHSEWNRCLLENSFREQFEISWIFASILTPFLGSFSMFFGVFLLGQFCMPKPRPGQIQAGEKPGGRFSPTR